MTRRSRFLLALGLVALTALPAAADDKDFLRPLNDRVPPNLLIVFGNSQTLTDTISDVDATVTSTWDGDGDSPGSKMGSAKRVVKQFVNDNHTLYNIGLTSFSHNTSDNIDIFRKHWVYESLGTAAGTVDFPNDSFKEPIGTLSRWGPFGEGPCTSKTTPACNDRSSVIDLTGYPSATVVGPFFGANPTSATERFIYLDGSTANNSHARIRHTIVAGAYGDAFDATVTTLKIGGTHSIEIKKEYQACSNGCSSPSNWITQAFTPAPGNSPGTVVVRYRPPIAFTSDLFYPASVGSPLAGQEIGFLSNPKADYNTHANCSGYNYQSNSAAVPMVKIPKDYYWGQACNPPQDSLACVKRLLRPQAYIETYQNGSFSTADPDNPGYTGSGSKYADGCDPNVLGAVQANRDVLVNNVILTTQNGSQAPIKKLLEDIAAYFNDPKHDGFKNGVRLDDPNAICRNSAAILIYDTFNGCQNDKCDQLNTQVLRQLKQIGVPVYVIGFGASANQAACASPPDQDTESCVLKCIPKYTGAVLEDLTTPGYFPVTNADDLYIALTRIANLVNESQKGFVSSTVSVAQASGEQVTFLATFNAASSRSIWNGRVNAYKLDESGNLQLGFRTIDDPNDPNTGITVPAPSNADTSLMWNAGENLADTPGTGATDSAAVLQPGASLDSSKTYVDNSNDTPSTIKTHFYPGRKIVFALPQSYPNPPGPTTTLPFPASDALPESRFDLVAPPGDPPYLTPPSYWPALKALLGTQSSPPFALSPPIEDKDARDSLRFIWGDRDAVILEAQPSAADTPKLYAGQKLGDIFHASPVLVGTPNDFASFITNLNNYQAFRKTYEKRRRVLYAPANDGLLHAFDAGAWDRDPSKCAFEADGVTRRHCYDLGTGAELFAFAPRAIMQIFRGLKNTIGPQTKRNEWTVDGALTAGDVFIDSNYSGTPAAADRTWHTVLLGGMREGSPFEGTSGAAPADSQGSYYALDITQPDALGADSDGNPITITPGNDKAPLCLDDGGAGGDATCGHDAPDPTVRSNQPPRSWPTVLWEISDVGDQDVGSTGATYVDMGETWSKPALGRVRICTTNCGNTSPPFPVNEDHYVAIFGGGFDRERLNRRGNWLYMVDVETGKVLYRVNSSCGINAGTGGCGSPVYFASIPSEPSAIDANGDGIIDLLYVGDLKGRVWRIDLTDLRLLASPPTGRFNNKIDVDAGSGKPFLFFDAPQPVAPAVHPFYPIYYRPTVIALGFSVSGKPALGIGFGTGDRDDITGNLEPTSLTYKQRFYYVVDRNNGVTRTESDLLDIASPTAAGTTTAPDNGWFLELPLGERMNADILTSSGVIFFTTFNPLAALSGTGNCTQNTPKCGLANGTARLYRVFYSTGNPYLGTDRGETQQFGGFLSEPVYFQSLDQQGNIIYTTENTVKKEKSPGGKKTTVKSWKERSRRP